MSTSQTLAHPIAVIPPFSATIVSACSPEYQEARMLQMQRFARASKPGSSAYLQTVDLVPEYTLPLVVHRHDLSQSAQLVATAILELPSASIIESVVQFTPGSSSASILQRGAFAEIRGFATQFGVPPWEVLDIVDVIGHTIVHLAKQSKVESLWLVPRRPLMSLLLAQVPGLLPPYRFRLCQDISGWKESDCLQEMRKLRLKEIAISSDHLPTVYQITPDDWACDLRQRLALRAKRQQEPEFPRLLQIAMHQAYQQVHAEIALLNEQNT